MRISQVESRGGNTITTTASITEGSSCLRFNTGRQQTLLPAGLSLCYPSVVPRGRAFSFELGWIASGPSESGTQPTTDADAHADASARGGSPHTAARSHVVFPTLPAHSPFLGPSTTSSTSDDSGTTGAVGGGGGQEGRVERQRLLRTYDADGLVVSTTLIREAKVEGS